MPSAAAQLRSKARGLLRGQGAIAVRVDTAAMRAQVKAVSKTLKGISDDIEDKVDAIIVEEAEKCVDRIQENWPTAGSVGWNEPTGFSNDQWEVVSGGHLSYFIRNLASYAKYVHPPKNMVTLYDSLVLPEVNTMQTIALRRISEAISKAIAKTGAGVAPGVQTSGPSFLSRLRAFAGL